VRVTLSVNGERHELELQPLARLADVLRDELGLVGTKIGCGEGACGACAVLVDGRSVNSCLLLAAAAEGHEVETIEGLSRDGLTPLQEAFVAADAVQCGFCTSGQVVSATALLRAEPAPSADTVRRAMSGNLCRCGCYVKIEQAILETAGEVA
jgi:aerobic-type carbon monoxide dehydrogenase small subunit (CoxS/CutS family)